MSETVNRSAELTPERINELIKKVFRAKGAIRQILTADVPVMSPVTSRYRDMLAQYSQMQEVALEEIGGDKAIIEIADFIHNQRCGCAAYGDKGTCDWHRMDQGSSERRRRVLQAAEVRIQGFSARELVGQETELDTFIDRLEEHPLDK